MARLFAVIRRGSRDLPVQMEDNHLRILTFGVLALVLPAQVFGSREATAQGTQPDLPGVAVMDFTGFMLGEGGNSAPLGKAVSAMLTTELSGREGMRIVERQHLQDLLTEQRLALSGRVDEATAIEVGKMVGAQYVIHGQVSAVGGVTRMDMRAVDVETSEVFEVQKVTGETTELLTLVVRIADLFSSQLHLTPPSDRVAPEPIPVQATIAFSRGLDFEDRGETEEAAEQYRQALEIFPGHRDARKALDRLQGGGEGT